MQRALVILALVCTAEASWNEFRKLNLGKAKQDPLELRAKTEEDHPTAQNKQDLVGTGNATAKAFVINLERRRDRCICMSHQLAKAPFKAERFNAVTMSDPRREDQKFTLKFTTNKTTGVQSTTPEMVWNPVVGDDLKNSELCDGAFKNGVVGGTHSILNEMALFCSHLHLWQKLEKEPEDAFVVMEDDLPMSSLIFDKINNFIKNYKGKWDFVQVDAYDKNGHVMPDADKVDEFEGTPIYKPSANGKYWGGHMFLLRKSALPKMIHRLKTMQSKPVDWLPLDYAKSENIVARTVQFGLIEYINKEKRDEYYKESNCGQNVELSDINFSGQRAAGNQLQNYQRGQNAVNEGALECPVMEEAKKNLMKGKAKGKGKQGHAGKKGKGKGKGAALEVLPEGWKSAIDPTTSKKYYFVKDDTQEGGYRRQWAFPGQEGKPVEQGKPAEEMHLEVKAITPAQRQTVEQGAPDKMEHFDQMREEVNDEAKSIQERNNLYKRMMKIMKVAESEVGSQKARDAEKNGYVR